MAKEVTLETLDKKIDEAVDDLSSIVKEFASHVDMRMNEIEKDQKLLRDDMRRVFDYLDSIAKRQEINLMMSVL